MNSSHAMERCLALAIRGYGLTKPNPMVGCVIIKNGEIVGEGWHRYYGGPHAEVEALKMAGERAKGSTVVVNLEPCAHTGKTPPCTEALITAGVNNVIVAMKDPNPVVSGKGIRTLRSAGIGVEVGEMKAEAIQLNETFVWWHTRKTPFVAVKWGQTLNGYAADASRRSKWITGEQARTYVHGLRAGYGGIIVGARTVREDDPLLTVRHVPGRNPIRVVIDGALRLLGTEKVFDTAEAPTILITRSVAMKRHSAVLRRLASKGVDVFGLDAGKGIPVQSVLRLLGGEGITSLFVEGGPLTTDRFLKAKVVNLVYAFIHAGFLGAGVRAPGSYAGKRIGAMRSMSVRDVRTFEKGDVIVEAEMSR